MTRQLKHLLLSLSLGQQQHQVNLFLNTGERQAVTP